MSDYVLKAAAKLPILDGLAASLNVWARSDGRDETVVLMNRPRPEQDCTPLLRIHSACLTGDVLGSLKCDCRAQLSQALNMIGRAEWGILIYPLDHEGRGIGLANKVQSYAHQDRGLNTFEANAALGFDHDLRDYRGCARILSLLGVKAVRILTRNPSKVAALEQHGVEVMEVIPLDVPENPFNGHYLQLKREMFDAMSNGASGTRIPGGAPRDP